MISDNELSGMPFCLSDEEVAWVRRTLCGMSTEDRLRQLFCLVVYGDDEEYCRYIGQDVRPGGYMSRPMSLESSLAAARRMQKYSKIPLLVAANLEAGGNGAVSEGTRLGSPMEIAATGDIEFARRLGEVCGVEGGAAGISWAFAPIADIDYNWRNPITNTRTFGSDPHRVAELCTEYIKEVQRRGLAASAKHFPGDGRDERDQHVAVSVNDMSCEEWDGSYGRVYSACIAAGVKTIMVGHILQPAYTRRLCPGIKDGEILPASVSYPLVTGLLRERLGFHGLVVTDSSTMAGVAVFLPRERLVPMAIAAGCDMFLFTRSLEEDLEYMRRGYEDGIITPERLSDAVTRILALKASLGLPERAAAGRLVPDISEARERVGKAQFCEWARECAERAITLVKEEPGVLPLTPERYPRVLFYPLENKSSGATVFNVDASENRRFSEALRREGFRVTVFEPSRGFEGMMTPVREFTEKYDLIIYSAAIQTRSNQTTVRIEWAPPMGVDVPTLTHTIPTVFVSLENPYHMIDVPHVRTFINCYSGSEEVIGALMEKLTGRDGFLGVSPSDVFVGRWSGKE